MFRHACVLAVLVFALGTTAPAYAQSEDTSPANREVRQLLGAAQEQIAAGSFAAAGTTLDNIPTLGSISQREVSLFLYLRGQVFYELGQVGQAVSIWTQAVAIGGLPEAQQQALEAALARLAERAAPAGTPESPQALLQAADQASQFGRADEAATYYESAIKSFAADRDSTGLARAHYGFGNHLARARSDFEGALAQYASAVEYAERSDETPLLRSVLGAMGGAAIVVGRAEQGRAAFERVLMLLGDEDVALRAGALAGLGEASLRLKDWPAAVHAHEQWLAVAGTSDNPAAPRLLHSYLLALRLAGREDEALAMIARLDGMAESDDERARLALQLEQDGARARALEHVSGGCWFDARAQERYVALGRNEDAEILQAVMDAERCSEAASD